MCVLLLSGCAPQAYAFQGYWEDIGTIDAFYSANLALVNSDGRANFSFYDKDAPIYTMSRFLPPSKVMDSKCHPAWPCVCCCRDWVAKEHGEGVCVQQAPPSSRHAATVSAWVLLEQLSML